MLYTVDPKVRIVTFGGQILVGWGEDQFDIERAAEQFDEMVGCNGDTVRIMINNNNATAKLTFLESSPTNDYLSRVTGLDKRLGQGVLPFTVRDSLGTTFVSSPMAYIKKISPISSGKSVKTREWNLYLVDCQIISGGNFPAF
jgi:hypothetical protein